MTDIQPAHPGVIRIAHCGDPQLGFCEPRGTEEAYQADLARCERLIEKLNGMDIDLVYLAGDAVHRNTDLERDWPRLLTLFHKPVVMAPGNHDMGQTLTPENLNRFLRVFGSDRASFKIGKWRFICGNSQYWLPTAALPQKAEYEAWFDAELAAAKANGEPVIFASHISPFIYHAGEEDSYENAPLVLRPTLLDKLLDAGVRFHLGGHTHRMIARAHGGMIMLNAETTCCNFDDRPLGFRLFELADNGDYTWNFVPLS